MKYISTRGVPGSEGAELKSFDEVLLQGLAPDGGLYVPTRWPKFDYEELSSMAGASYVDVALMVIYPFVGEFIPKAELKKILKEVYQSDVFDHACVAPLTQLSPNLYNMELHRGPTLAFKDVALQLLGRLFDYTLQKEERRLTIVGATSGDTGSAAIEGCKNCDNVDVFILFPQGRVSDVQRRQMTTVKGSNIHNIALDGTFDDCQAMVKAMFSDREFKTQMQLSAVNSINWARIMAQIVYYFTTAISLGAPGRKVSFTVPTGNFGNVYAAYAARQMGLPIKTLAIATNRNDILTRFFETGSMASSGVHASISPSMDIQISSNFERYLFDLVGRDATKLTSLMNMFRDSVNFGIDQALKDQACMEFKAYRTDDEQTLAMMQACYAETGEIIDPHTAVGLNVALQVAKGDPKTPMVNLACAHAAKFPDAVKKATGIHPELPERLADLHERDEFMTPLRNDLKSVQNFIKRNARITR
jgi:threonine synthase